MQLTGRQCAICGERVIAEIDARGCTHCETVFHDRCLAEQDAPLKCPECKHRLDEEPEPDRKVATHLMFGKALTVTIATVVLSLLTVFNVYAFLHGDPYSVLRLGLAALLFYFVFQGRIWAKILAGLACLGQLVLVFAIGDPFATAVLATVFGASGLALLLDPRIDLYVQHRRPRKAA